MTRIRLAYQPHPPGALVRAEAMGGLHPQEAFHEDRGRVFYRAILAGTSTGKTRAGAFEAISCALSYPGTAWGAYEPNYGMVRRNMIPTITQTLGHHPSRSPLVRRYNEQDHIIEFQNDAVIHFGSLEQPASHEGANLDGVWVDEPRLVRRWSGSDGAFQVLDRRLRGTGNLKAGPVGLWITTSAPNRVLHEQWERPDSTAYLGRDSTVAVYRWTPYDNPYNPPGYADRMARAHQGTSHVRFILGEYGVPEGLVFAGFDARRHATSMPSGEPTAIGGGIDWGWTEPAAIILAYFWGERVHYKQYLYGTHIPLRRIKAEARRIDEELGGRVRWHGGHDRPEDVEELARAGLTIESHKGPVLARIHSMADDFANEYASVDAESVELIEEMENMEWDPDKEEAIMPCPDHGIDAGSYARSAVKTMKPRGRFAVG